MNEEYKKLKVIDLCTRLPYGIYANLPNHHLVSHKYYIYEFNVKNEWTNGILYCAGREQIYGAKIEDIQPYLRPMSSMTEEEAKEIATLHGLKNILSVKITTEYIDVIIDDGFSSTERITLWYDELISSIESFDWLNRRHFDYRDLIKKGLAIEAPKDMYAID